MINSKLDHCKTIEEFYKSIRSQQEKAHGDNYCAMHDAINEIAKDTTKTWIHFCWENWWNTPV